MENDIFYYATRVINGSITLSGFDKIYSFATENIDGYLSKLELKNKKVLTVGSSADQVFDLITYGVNDIELVDINPFAKYYYELKKAGIITLSYEEFLNFFCYMKYNGKRNKDTFNKKH